MTRRPLEGVRVLDLSRLYPGALTTMKLADLGAEVVKVEKPGKGDYIRNIPPMLGDESVLHLVCDRGKKSIELDLRDDAGQETFQRLAAAADAVIETSRPGGALRIGLDFRALRASHPHLVLCSLTGFGQTGPLAPLASHGMNMDVLAGAAQLEDLDGRPALTNQGFSVGVELGAANAALAIVSCIFEARAVGEGAWVDISCWDAAVEASRLPLGNLLAGGTRKRMGPLYDVYECRDGELVLFCAIERKFWEAFCREVDREDLMSVWSGTDVDFGDASLRSELEGIFATRTADHWFERFREWDLPGSRIMTDLHQVIALDHFRDREMGSFDPETGVPKVSSPIRWMDGGARAGDDAGRAPDLGDHTDEVLHAWSEAAPRPSGAER